MDHAGTIRFPGNLDPTAEEFRPSSTQIAMVQPPIPYLYPPPLTCPPPPPAVPLSPPLSPPPSAAPTRTLLLTGVPVESTPDTILREMEVFGAVRAIQMERLLDGMVTVHFFDLRHAEAALMVIREQHMHQQNRLRNHYSFLLMVRPNVPVHMPVPPPGYGLILGRTIWAQFVFPVCVPVHDAYNHGTIVVFNLDSAVSASQLKDIFEAFGVVKEVRETPMKRHQRFLEYFDIRDAERAIKEMEGKEINGKRVLIEFSRPGGHRSRFTNNNMYTRPLQPPSQPPPPRSFSRSTSDASSNSTPPKNKNPNSKKRLPRSCEDAEVLATAVAGMSMNNNGSASDKSCNSGSSMKSSKKKNNNGGSSKQTKNSKSFKGRSGKLFDSQFLIKDDAISESIYRRDPRTTVMIKNIPNKYSQKLLLNMLDNHCIHCNEQQFVDGEDQPLSSYDFLYLPIDFNNKCNVGYGFVNFTSPEATLRFYKAFHKQHWEVFNSRKICEISYARLQGLEALKEHFKNSKFACETDEYLPVLFEPSRDGKQVTEPMAIGGHNNAGASTSSSSRNGSEGEEQVVLVDNDEWLHGDHDEDHDNDTGDDDDDEDSTITSAEAISPNYNYHHHHYNPMQTS